MKKLLNVNGAQELTAKEQLKIQGGAPACAPICGGCGTWNYVARKCTCC